MSYSLASKLEANFISQVEIGDINGYVPSDGCRDRWLEQTSTSFDPIDAAMLLKTHDVECPECSTHIDARMLLSTRVTIKPIKTCDSVYHIRRYRLFPT